MSTDNAKLMKGNALLLGYPLQLNRQCRAPASTRRCGPVLITLKSYACADFSVRLSQFLQAAQYITREQLARVSGPFHVLLGAVPVVNIIASDLCHLFYLSRGTATCDHTANMRSVADLYTLHLVMIQPHTKPF